MSIRMPGFQSFFGYFVSFCSAKISHQQHNKAYLILYLECNGFFLSTGTKLAAEEGQFLSGVNLYIPREDVAKFMLGCLDAESPWQRKAVAIGIPK